MTFRTRLFLVSSLTVAGAVALVTGAVSVFTRNSFEEIDRSRRDALINQFQRELQAQSAEVARKVEKIAASQEVLRIAIEAARAQPDFSIHLNEAQTQAEAQALDFLDIVDPSASIISSAHWPARFGYKNDWLVSADDWAAVEPFLARVPQPEGKVSVALAAVRPVIAGGKRIHVVGAKRLDSPFLAALGLAPGMRAFLWLSGQEVMDAQGPVRVPDRLAPIAEKVKQSGQQATGTVRWTSDRASTEALLALPLSRKGSFLGALIVATSLREQFALERSILWTGIFTGAAGILLGVLMGWWATERVTRPVEQLAAGARAVAAGDWETRVAVSSQDEIGELARTFNRMTEELIAQRERAIQAERVAAWRELARRLAHELKNPLFPLQITVENLERARAQHPDQFDEVFRESTSTLLAELANMKTIIGRFSDFAKMPAPRLEAVDVNHVAAGVLKLFDAQLRAGGESAIAVALELCASDATAPADPEQLGRALRNLVLNALDAMPEGGTLRIRTEKNEGGVRIEISDTGHGLTPEECERLFTPYYTTKHHGTGLGLAIVQSVVSDHGGRISVASEPGRGATFTIDLPARRDA